MMPEKKTSKLLIFLFIIIVIIIVSLYSSYFIFKSSSNISEVSESGEISKPNDDILALLEENIKIPSFSEYLWPIVFEPDNVECKAYTVTSYNESDVEMVLSNARDLYFESWRSVWKNRDVTGILLLSDMYVSFREVKFGLTALKINDVNKAIEAYAYGCIVIHRLENLDEYKSKIESILGRPDLSFDYFENIRAKFANKIEDNLIILDFKQSSLNYMFRLSDVNESVLEDVPICEIRSTLEEIRNFISSISNDPYLKAIYYDVVYYIFHVLLEEKLFIYDDNEIFQKYFCFLVGEFKEIFMIDLS